MSATCRSCQAPIVWVVTEATATKAGRRMPLDADSETGKAQKFEDGNLVPTGGSTPEGARIVRYVKKGPNLYRSHFASCPNASTWRKPKG